MTWLLAILGLTGTGVVATFLLGGGPALLLFGAKALGFLKRILPKAWLYIAIAAALVAAFFIHQHAAHKALKAQYAAGDAAGYSRAMKDVARQAAQLGRAARELKRKTDTATFKMAQQEQAQYGKDVAAHSALADELRHRQPPRLSPAGAGGRYLPSAASAPGAAGDGSAVDAGLAQIPWLPLIDHGQWCDDDHSARVRWDSWYARYGAELAKVTAPPPKP